MIEAVIFDMDGVLIDSEPFWREAEIEAFARVGLRLTHEMCLATTGLRIDEAVAYWRARHDGWVGHTAMEVQDLIVSGVIERVLEKGEAMPGVGHALEFCRRRKLKVALASSSSYRVIHAIVGRLALADAFDLIYSAEEEEYGKPHPGVYLTTAHRLGVIPTRCLAIEDSLNGVLAAKAARMKCVAIPEAEARHDSRFALADTVLDSLDGFGAATWKELESIDRA